MVSKEQSNQLRIRSNRLNQNEDLSVNFSKDLCNRLQIAGKSIKTESLHIEEVSNLINNLPIST